jgi:DNA-binding PadR family transcriptional regulator
MYIVVLCVRNRFRSEAMNIDKDLVAASATPMVLAILSEGESYGYAILKRVRELSAGEMEWTDGMLYPLLHRLHRLGYVTQEWRVPPEGRRRRYYAITSDGEGALAEHKRQWVTVSRALDDAWGGVEVMRLGWGAT